MTKAELEKFKTILETKQRELSGSLRNRDEIAIEKAPDALDEVQLAGERELAIRNLDRDSSVLRKVSSALLRIEDGSFGVCEECGEEIQVKRLEARPETTLCIRCKEDQERMEKDYS